MKGLLRTIARHTDRFQTHANDAYVVLNELDGMGPSTTAVGRTTGWAIYIGQVDFNRRNGRVIPGTQDQHLYLDDFDQAIGLALSAKPIRFHLIAAPWAERALLSLAAKSAEIMQFAKDGGKIWINGRDVTMDAMDEQEQLALLNKALGRS